jgi:NADP-dependent 3-hydroxy acid dehydrogenase YdfG
MEKVWFISDASSGFGQAFAEHAVELRRKVVIAARTISKLEKPRRPG